MRCVLQGSFSGLCFVGMCFGVLWGFASAWECREQFSTSHSRFLSPTGYDKQAEQVARSESTADIRKAKTVLCDASVT